MAQHWANSATTTLNGNITNSATSLTVATGDGALFPSTGPFRIRIGAEIIEAGARSTDTFSSLTRGVESTTAASHTSGDAVKGVLTAGQLALLHQIGVPELTTSDFSGSMPGTELGYASATSAVTTASTSFVDVTGMSLTVTVGSSPILLEFFCALADFTVASTFARFDVQLYDTTGAANVETCYVLANANLGGSLHVAARVNPSAGSRSYKVRFQSESGSATARLYADSSSPMWFRITTT